MCGVFGLGHRIILVSVGSDGSVHTAVLGLQVSACFA